jgi:cytoskeletal protein RodZ
MNLGEVLSSARKDSGISVDDLAAALSIRPGLLIEMERNNFIKCGGDVYARGHLRNIAPLLGLDSALLLSLYNAEHSIEGVSLNAQLVENNIARVPHEKKSISWKVPAAFSLVILLAVATVQIVVSNSSDVASPDPIVTAKPTSASTEPTPIATEPATEPTIEPSAPASSANVAMTLSASAAARIDIVINGTHVFKGEIAAGESKSFESDSSISVYFSDASAIEVTVNGENLGRLGGAGEVIRRTFR